MSDTSTLYSVEQGREQGILITPLSVTINNKTYREYEEITSEEFLDIISQGHLPSSSQPAFGEVLAGYDSISEEIINITMADGLSGTYESALSAASQSKNSSKITVINSKTLCGPHRYMVEKAVALANKGATKNDILAMLAPLIESAKSFLVPADFEYLKRGGRLAPLAANMMGLLKAIPVLVQSADGKRLEAHRVHRKERALFTDLATALRKHGVGTGWLISISHADNVRRATSIKEFLTNTFPAVQIDIFALSPSFITQGGPQCVSIQAVQMV